RRRVEVHRLQRGTTGVADPVLLPAFDRQQAAGTQPLALAAHHRLAGARHHVKPLVGAAVAIPLATLAGTRLQHHLRRLYPAVVEKHAEPAAESQFLVAHRTLLRWLAPTLAGAR